MSIPAPFKIWADKWGQRKPGKNLYKAIDEHLLWFRFENQLNQSTPLLVYQMGKVASTSVYHSLVDVYSGVVLHAHTFEPGHENWRIRRLYRWALEEGMPLDMISLTREPIGRNISAFFQNFERDTETPYQDHIYSMEQLRDLFLSNYNHEIPLLWFDKHVRDVFGIDIYSSPFPECGYAVFERGNKRLLVLRSELEDPVKVSAIQPFLNLTDFSLYQLNVGSKKEYAEEYRRFINWVKLPPGYCDQMLSSRYFNHFYDSEMAGQVRRRWCVSENSLASSFMDG